LVRDRHRQEAAAAYRAYDAEKATEWMGNPPTGAGSRGPIGQRAGDLCTLNGWPGRLRRDTEGNFYCDIGAHDAAATRQCPDCDGAGVDVDGGTCETCGGTGTVDDSVERNANEAVSNTSTHHESFGRRRMTGGDQVARDHRNKMAAYYAVYEDELRNAWKRR
jgi:hypothetical protein